MNKTGKYNLKLDYTADELKELKELRTYYFNPLDAIHQIVESGNKGGSLRNLGEKDLLISYEDKFSFVIDINNAVMGTAIFPEKKYVVHDSTTSQYIYYSTTDGLCWGKLRPEVKTKEEWLAINPVYEPMLERVED